MRRPNNNARSFALIITLIMVVLAAIIVVALLTNASLDRLTANAYSKRLRAEMAAQSGLAAALNALSGLNGPTDFRYITKAGDDGKPALIPLSYATATGVTTLDATHQRLLYSNGGTGGAILTLSTTTSPKTTRTADYISMTATVNGNPQEVQRYAFYVDESGGRQNITRQSGSDRIYSRDPNEVPLMTTGAAVAPFSAQQVTAVKNDRPAIFTPATLNPVLNAATVPLTPGADDYNFSTASGIANLSPDGKPRVDLTKLKNYIEGLPVDQTRGNDRAKLVDRLLDTNEKGTDWGGGNLAILAKLPRYSGNQPKQIVANLIDYLDSDLIPTTDDVDNPTYFGVEGKGDTNGKVSGHPYINFVGTGLVFNRSNASGQQGGLNSTRVLVVLGIVNPWSLETKDWQTFYGKPEIEITISGTASGGNLGSNASDYFHGVFNTTDNGNQLLTFPIAKIPPNTGYAFPTPMSSTTNYATFYDILGTSGRQPPGMTFDALGFTIKKLRLKYTSTDGKVGYVQVLDNLKTIAQAANPAHVDMGHSGGSLTFKFPSGAPGKTDFHLNADARLNFLSANWILSKSTEDGNPKPPSPQTTVNIFSGVDDKNWDFTGQAPSLTNHLWYTKTDITSDYYVKSPPADGSSPKLDSAGEMGFLHTGIPWETLRLYVTGNENAGKERDKEILEYVHSGTFSQADYRPVATHVGQTASATSIPLIEGPLNLNTNKRPTLQGLFRGVTATTDTDATSRAKSGDDADATNLADAVATNAAGGPLALASDFLALPAVKTLTNTGKDFDREIIARRVANVVGTQSTHFTIYTLGEARDKAGKDASGNAILTTSSTVNLRAEVEMQVDQNGRPMPKVLSTVYYTN